MVIVECHEVMVGWGGQKSEGWAHQLSAMIGLRDQTSDIRVQQGLITVRRV